MSSSANTAVASVPVERIAGRYRVERELAAGGMGVVSIALDESTGSRVAVKRLRAELSTHRRIRMQFELEYRTLAMLEHPRIIQVFDYGVDESVALLLAAAEGALGDFESANRRLDELTRERESEHSPLLMFEIHEIRLQPARALKRTDEYRHNLEQMYRWAKQVGNPAMLAHCERIAESGVQRGMPSSIPPPIGAAGDDEESVTEVRKGGAQTAIGEAFAACTNRDERARQALRLIAQRTQNDSAYLFLRREQGVVLAGALSAQQPPFRLEDKVQRLLDDDVTSAPDRRHPRRSARHSSPPVWQGRRACPGLKGILGDLYYGSLAS